MTYWRGQPSPSAARPGPPVLLLHGLAADHEGLRPLAGHLPDVDVIAVDLPGFGRSEPLAGSHTLAAYAGVVEALCAHLDLSDVAVIGHSLGASIALTHAATYPERVRALAMLMPVTTGSGPSTWLARGYFLIGSLLPPRAARLWFLSRAAVFISDRLTLVTTDPQIRDRILGEDYRTAALASPRAIQEIYRSLRRTPFLSLAGRIRAKTLILGAEHDGLVPPQVLARLRDRVRGSKLFVVPHAGHLWPVEHPHAAADLIVAAIGS